MLFRINHDLKHYASKYYDAEKAHEYYERTKQLKGRRSTKSLTEEGKVRWTYVKENVLKERKQVQDQVSKQRTAEIKAFRDKLKAEQKARAERNAQYYKSQIAKSMAEQKTQLEAVKAKIQDVKKLKKIPANATKQQKERIRMENARISEQNAQIREQNKQSRARSSIQKRDIREDFQEIRRDYKTESTQILNGIREMYKEKISTGVESIRQKYSGSRDVIKEKYEGILDAEYANILAADGADTAKGQNTGQTVKRSAEEKRKIREQLAAERKQKAKK